MPERQALTCNGSTMTEESQGAAGPEARAHPERIGAYRVDSVIGAGGMGVVYRAFDEALQRPVALKTLLPALTTDPEFVARFKREAQSAAALNHANITQIYSIGQEGPTPFFAMELIKGCSLESIVKDRGALDSLEAARFIQQAAQGLRHAAEKNLIHRDVKPSNLMLAEGGVVKITDFGLAKPGQSQTQLTATGEVLGSPGYISPEQAQGSTLDARSDIYSLGATFYHLVTGKLPFDAPTPVAMIIKHMKDPLKPPRAVNPAVPYPISSLIQRMMAKRPAERFPDYDTLLRELERALQAVESSPGASTGVVAAGGVASGALPRGEDVRPGRQRPGGRSRVEPSTVEPARSSSWMPVTLIVLLGGLIVAGVILRNWNEAGATIEGSHSTDASVSVDRVAEPQGSIDSGVSFSTGPESVDIRTATTGVPPRRPARRSLRSRRQNRPLSTAPAQLQIIDSDHELRADGRLRVFGQVHNVGGGAATGARVRIKVMDGADREVARGESSIYPATIEPSGTASFEVTIDDVGPFTSLSAEVLWRR
jgi:serine/threonine protein kinase